MTAQGLDDFARQYLVTALWAETDGGDLSLESSYGIHDFAPEAIARAIKDCREFQELARGLYDDEGRAGHDFWLTRCGHGAGFWDGDYPEHGDKLTEISNTFGTLDVYVGDDGKLHLM